MILKISKELEPMVLIDGYLFNSFDADTLCDAKINKNKISKTLPTGNGNAKERKNMPNTGLKVHNGG